MIARVVAARRGLDVVVEVVVVFALLSVVVMPMPASLCNISTSSSGTAVIACLSSKISVSSSDGGQVEFSIASGSSASVLTACTCITPQQKFTKAILGTKLQKLTLHIQFYKYVHVQASQCQHSQNLRPIVFHNVCRHGFKALKPLFIMCSVF